MSATLPAAGSLPPNLSMPYGLLSFEVNGVTPSGNSGDFSVYVDANAPVNGYYKKNRVSGRWENIATAITTVGTRKRIDFTLTDGDDFDTAGMANGRIADPGGPGSMSTAAAVTRVPILSPWAMATLAVLMAGSAGFAGGRRRH